MSFKIKLKDFFFLNSIEAESNTKYLERWQIFGKAYLIFELFLGGKEEGRALFKYINWCLS